MRGLSNGLVIAKANVSIAAARMFKRRLHVHFSGERRSLNFDTRIHTGSSELSGIRAPVACQWPKRSNSSRKKESDYVNKQMFINVKILISAARRFTHRMQPSADIHEINLSDGNGDRLIALSIQR
jgi:hypothetical protein